MASESLGQWQNVCKPSRGIWRDAKRHFKWIELVKVPRFTTAAKDYGRIHRVIMELAQENSKLPNNTICGSNPAWHPEKARIKPYINTSKNGPNPLLKVLWILWTRNIYTVYIHPLECQRQRFSRYWFKKGRLQTHLVVIRHLLSPLWVHVLEFAPIITIIHLINQNNKGKWDFTGWFIGITWIPYKKKQLHSSPGWAQHPQIYGSPMWRWGKLGNWFK